MKAMIHLPVKFSQHCHYRLAERYISTISINNLSRLYTNNVNRPNENGLILEKKKKKKKIMDTDYVDLVLFTNAPGQVK